MLEEYAQKLSRLALELMSLVAKNAFSHGISLCEFPKECRLQMRLFSLALWNSIIPVESFASKPSSENLVCDQCLMLVCQTPHDEVCFTAFDILLWRAIARGAREDGSCRPAMIFL